MTMLVLQTNANASLPTAPFPAPIGAPIIQVQRNKLVDGTGKVVQMRGVNMATLEFYPIDIAATNAADPDYWGGGLSPISADGKSYANPAPDIFKTWGVNSVRLPLNEQSYLAQICFHANGTSANGDPQNKYRAVVKQFVDYCTALGMYVILDLHKNSPKIVFTQGQPAQQAFSDSGTQQNMSDADNSPAFWKMIATDYKNYPNVIFDLFNEPTLVANVVAPPAPALWVSTAAYSVGTAVIYTTADNPALQYFLCIANNTNQTCPQHPVSWLSITSAQWAEWTAWRDGGVTNILYGSESTFTQNWNTAGMQSLVDAVRSVGATQIVIAGAPSWQQDLSLWLHFTPVDPLKQIAAGWHAYPASGNDTQPGFPDGFNWANAVLAAGYPMILGETGDRSYTGATAVWFPTLLPWCTANSVSVLPWSWNPWSGQADDLIKDLAGTPTDGQGVYYKAYTQSFISGGTPVAKATINITLPVNRKDGTAFTPAMYSAANIYKNGVKYATVAAPALTWSDTVAAVNGDSYTVSIVDTETPAVEGDRSTPFVVTISTALSPPSAPTITGSVA